MRKPGLFAALATAGALIVGGAVALPAAADNPTEWVDGGALTLHPAGGKVTFGDQTQTLSTSGSCNLSTSGTLMSFAGSIGSSSKPVGYKSGSLGVQEVLAAYCNLVDTLSTKGPETLTLKLGSQMVNFAQRPLRVGSATIPLTVSSVLGKKAQIDAVALLNGVQVGTVTVKQGAGTCAVPDGGVCTLTIGGAFQFDTVRLTAKNGLFSLRGAATFATLSEVDKQLDCTDSTLTEDNATVTYLGTFDDSGAGCPGVGVVLTAEPQEVNVTKRLDVDPTAQFIVAVEWTDSNPGTSPSAALKGVRITFEPGTTETPLSFCPAFLYDGGELAGVQDAADLAQLTPDFEPAVPGTQYACLGAPRTADIGPDSVTIHDQVFVYGDAKMRLG